MQTTLSEKGQVVLPRDIRRRFNWNPGKKFEVIEHADGITLRAVRSRAFLPPHEVFAGLRAIRPTQKPALTDEQIHEIVRAAAAARHHDG